MVCIQKRYMKIVLNISAYGQLYVIMYNFLLSLSLQSGFWKKLKGKKKDRSRLTPPPPPPPPYQRYIIIYMQLYCCPLFPAPNYTPLPLKMLFM